MRICTTLSRRQVASGLMFLAAVAGSAPRAAADDRLEAARKKGVVTWYTSVAPDELRKEISALFKSKTGLDLVIYYGGTGQVFSRLVTERKTRAFNVDVVTLGDADLVGDLVKMEAVKPYAPSNAASIEANYRDAGNHWIGIAFWGLTRMHNTGLVKNADLPSDWVALGDPRWLGKLVISDPARSAAGLLMLKAMVKAHGWDWVEKLVRNEPLVIAIAPGIDQAVASGERALGTGVTSFVSETMKAGAPIAVAGDVLLTSPLTASVVAQAPNPQGAELLIDFLTSKEVGEQFRRYGWFSPRKDVAGPYGFPAASELKVVYPQVDLDMPREQIIERYNSIVQAAKR